MLGLAPHPEGGHYRQTFSDSVLVDGRPVSTAIYYLLAAGERSHWHKVDADEIWHYHAGAPLALSLSEDGRASETLTLGPDLPPGSGRRASCRATGGSPPSLSALDARRLHGCARLPLRGLRTRPARMVACELKPVISALSAGLSQADRLSARSRPGILEGRRPN